MKTLLLFPLLGLLAVSARATMRFSFVVCCLAAAVVRLYDSPVRTSLCWLDPEKGTLTEALKLPSGGDTSYAGMVWHDDLLWISYYSSHESKTSIYFAKVNVSGSRSDSRRQEKP